MKKFWFLKMFEGSPEKNSEKAVTFLNKHDLQPEDFKICSQGRVYEVGVVSVYYFSEQELAD